MDHGFSQKISRRSVLKKLSLLAGAVPVSFIALTSSSQAQDKISQTKAAYQDSARGDQHCAKCSQFMPENECSLVEGEISPSGWCIFYKAKR